MARVKAKCRYIGTPAKAGRTKSRMCVYPSESLAERAKKARAKRKAAKKSGKPAKKKPAKKKPAKKKAAKRKRNARDERLDRGLELLEKASRSPEWPETFYAVARRVSGKVWMPEKEVHALAMMIRKAWDRGEKPRKRSTSRPKTAKRKRNAAASEAQNTGGADRSSRVFPSRVIKRAPAGKLDGATLAELGDALEVEIDGYRITWPKGQATLAWSPDRKALVILQGGRRGKPQPPASGRESRAFERWSDRDARREATIDIRPRGSWRSIGSVRRIDYHSDKWGARREYTHKTGSGVRLYRYGAATKPPWIWVIKGGRLTVTARGIVG